MDVNIWNGGIAGDCQFCMEAGYVYRNASLDSIITMCDACRDDIERRKKYAALKTTAKDWPDRG